MKWSAVVMGCALAAGIQAAGYAEQPDSKSSRKLISTESMPETPAHTVPQDADQSPAPAVTYQSNWDSGAKPKDEDAPEEQVDSAYVKPAEIK